MIDLQEDGQCKLKLFGRVLSRNEVVAFYTGMMPRYLG